MIDNVTTVQADSVEEAVEIALSQLNLSRQEVDVHVISEGKKGFLGFGKQPAVVEVSAKDITVSDVAKQVVEEVIETTQPLVEETPKASITVKEIAKEPKNLDESEVVEEVIVEETVGQTSNDATQAMSKEEGSVVKEKDGYEIVKNYLEDILTAYGVEDAKVTYRRKGTEVTFDIETDKPGIVIGRQGKNLNALQVVAQILFHRYEPRRMSIMLNVGDYRERRANVLTKMAQRAARQVQKTKQEVILEPLPAYERKQIHAIISRYDNLSTKSEGKDPNRFLIIQYKEA
ncbi:RNA-binding cell elongation regulator Jag/EloR [Dolosicoccus paucivorans]|uniref:RNA-binding cell elongation regulator Jag/EloR n=1 Tax=Dolosicoccus paucivorans TaxID=84521 RepID=UPI000890D9CA|nr:RNA-binding cell elongation regulator Jag/EloR [Dolosicoccus paucivorans]SDI93011.1 spoIIIJ-associated protein [Dolosicoccus paucivorans]